MVGRKERVGIGDPSIDRRWGADDGRADRLAWRVATRFHWNRDGRLSRGCSGSSSRNGVLERGSIGPRQRSESTRGSLSPARRSYPLRLLLLFLFLLFPFRPVPTFLASSHGHRFEDARHASRMHALRPSIPSVARESARASHQRADHAATEPQPFPNFQPLAGDISAGLGKSRKVSEGLRRFQKVLGGFRRFQKVSGGFNRFQEVSEGFR